MRVDCGSGNCVGCDSCSSSNCNCCDDVATAYCDLGKMAVSGCYVGSPKYNNIWCGLCGENTPAHTAVSGAEACTANLTFAGTWAVCKTVSVVPHAYNVCSYECCGAGRYKVNCCDMKIALCAPCCIGKYSDASNNYGTLERPARYQYVIVANAAAEEPNGNYMGHDRENVARNLVACGDETTKCIPGCVIRLIECATLGTAFTVGSWFKKGCSALFSSCSIEDGGNQFEKQPFAQNSAAAAPSSQSMNGPQGMSGRR